jgi:hypothetical protein
MKIDITWFKSCLLSVRDWDGFQTAMRVWAGLNRVERDHGRD